MDGMDFSLVLPSGSVQVPSPPWDARSSAARGWGAAAHPRPPALGSPGRMPGPARWARCAQLTLKPPNKLAQVLLQQPAADLVNRPRLHTRAPQTQLEMKGREDPSALSVPVLLLLFPAPSPPHTPLRQLSSCCSLCQTLRDSTLSCPQIAPSPNTRAKAANETDTCKTWGPFEPIPSSQFSNVLTFSCCFAPGAPRLC